MELLSAKPTAHSLHGKGKYTTTSPMNSSTQIHHNSKEKLKFFWGLQLGHHALCAHGDRGCVVNSWQDAPQLKKKVRHRQHLGCSTGNPTKMEK